MNKEDRRKMRDNITRIQHKIVDTAEHIIDVVAAGLKPPQEPRKAPAHVARRQIANMLRVSQYCASRACRRSHCCRGEPAHCLQAVIPLLPEQAFDGLLKRKRPLLKPRSPAGSGSRTRCPRPTSAPSRSAASGIRR